MSQRKPRKRAKIRVPRRDELAAPPGTVESGTGVSPIRADLFSFGPDDCVERLIEKQDDVQIARGNDRVSWINVEGVENTGFLGDLGTLFGWHALVLEDIVSQHQRPKVEDYDAYVFVVLHMPTPGEGFGLEQLNLTFGENWVVTVQSGEPGDPLEPVRNRIRNARGRIRNSGGDYLAYAIIDSVVDHWFPVVERLAKRLDVLESQLGSESDAEILNELHAIRNDLHSLWRTVSATREAVGKLVRGEAGTLADETRVFFRDCQDHCSQLLDAISACQELSSSMMSLQQAAINNRVGDTMRVLTMIATVFIPMSFVAAVYGMNFDRSASKWNMPELGWSIGYPFALILMASIAFAFLTYFWRRGWIGTGTRTKRVDESSFGDS